MKLVTFNIRCDYGHDGENNFVYRKPLILKKIAQEQPDVLCFQEVLPHVALWLRESLKDYYVIGCGRSPELQDEQMTVAFRADRFNLLEMETYWLSETPYVPGSRYAEQSNCPRVITQAVLQETGSGKVFRLVNVHLDHVGALARELGLAQILKHIDEAKFCPDAPVVITGDFNTTPDGPELKAFDRHPGYTDVTRDVGVTFHGFGKAASPCPIDYIFLRGGISCDKVEKWTDVENGVFLSDHYPVSAELRFE